MTEAVALVLKRLTRFGFFPDLVLRICFEIRDSDFEFWGAMAPQRFPSTSRTVYSRFQFRNQARTDLGGADRLALVGVRAIAETFGVHRRNHL